jgi:hypothetical protein
MSMSDQVNETAASFGDVLRANPVGASLIGMGLFWMLAGARTGEAMLGAARVVGNSALPKQAGFGNMATSAREAMSDTARVAGDYVSGMADAAQKSFGEIADSATSAMSPEGGAFAYLDSTRRSLGRMLSAQPLLLAAGGLALGAAIAASLPRTNVETRALGDTAEELKRRAGAVVSEAAGAARSTLQDVAASAQDEAEKRGLTPDALKEKAGDVINQATGAAREAGKDAGLI